MVEVGANPVRKPTKVEPGTVRVRRLARRTRHPWGREHGAVLRLRPPAAGVHRRRVVAGGRRHRLAAWWPPATDRSGRPSSPRRSGRLALENLARRGGFKGFNQHNVSVTMQATHPRDYVPR